MRTKLAIIGAAVSLARAAFAVTMASQPWTTNRIAEAEARVAVKITAATNAIPAPDFSTGNEQLRATIVAVSPPADLTDATNHTRAALSAFAGTGTVERARSYGTPTRWTDASGDVWEIVRLNGWNVVNQGLPEGEAVDWHGPSWVTDTDGYYYQSVGWYVSSSTRTPDIIGTDPDATTLVLDWQFWRETESFEIHTVFSRPILTNNVGRVALTNDIPATLPESDPTVPSWAKAGTKPSYSWNEITGKPQVVDETGAAAIAETVVREKSLGGIWDTQLEVWWTPVMRNGALTYQATTNVNLSAEGN